MYAFGHCPCVIITTFVAKSTEARGLVIGLCVKADLEIDEQIMAW